MKAFSLFTLVGIAAVALPSPAQIAVSLTSSSTTAAVGIPVTWSPQIDTSALSADADTGPFLYRYRIRRVGQDFHMLRDFGPKTDLTWAASEHEGTYEIELTVRDSSTGASVSRKSLFQVTPVATGTPVLTSTSNPLVFLYSAPPCAPGSRMRVQFQDPSGYNQTTPYKSCAAGLSMNFYLAGMQADTAYQVHHTVDTGSAFLDGPTLTAVTGDLPYQFAPYTLLQAKTASANSGVLLQSTISEPAIATDLNGNVVWFYAGSTTPLTLTRPESGGRFLAIHEEAGSDPSHQTLQEFDLAGNTIIETNAARINEQLAAMNVRQITAFHHEATRLADGTILALGATEQILTDVQGRGPQDVLGDMILVLDQNMQVVWTWDAFDYLDTSRPATLYETCHPSVNGCPPFYLAPQANDWLHGNALQLTPDGNILYSIRHQDWLVKIDYENGAGSGNIIWRLGKDGDFTYDSRDPYPWFSHQHDANFEFINPAMLAVFDDGNLRQATNPLAHSRGQVIKLDEQNRIATLAVNADLGAYSFALGSAHRLPSGNYHFEVGWVIDPISGAVTSQAVEVDPFGNMVYDIQAATPEYRSFRMTNLYIP